MNIFIIEIASDGTIGGSHTCLYNLVDNLDREKYNIFIGFYQNNPYVDKFRTIGIPVKLLEWKPIEHGNVIIRKLSNWYRLRYKHKIHLTNIINENMIELVVLNNSIKPCNDIVEVCDKLKIPVIAYERGYLQYHPQNIKMTKKLYASIAVSLAVKNNMVKQNYGTNIHVIYDGMYGDSYMNQSVINCESTIKNNIGIPQDSIILGIVGNIREWKGQEFFVRAFMNLAEKHRNMYGLVIGGHGPDDQEYLDSIKKIAECSEAGQRLKFLGFRKDVPDLLKIMDVFVHASIKPEPFGMVLLEAMLYKIPIIATNFGGPVEILGNGRCGILVPPQDVDAIAKGVEKYLGDPNFKAEMVERAHKRVVEEFDQRKTVNIVETLFQEAVNDANHRI